MNLTSNITYVNNHIYFYDEINNETSLELIKYIKMLSESYNTPDSKFYNKTRHGIYIHINSTGGDFWDSVAIYNSIRSENCPIFTVVDSKCYSGAMLILMAGVKSYMHKTSKLLMHNINSSFLGDSSMAVKHMVNLDEAVITMKQLYKDNTIMTDEEIEQMLHSETFINYDTALKFEIIDGEM